MVERKRNDEQVASQRNAPDAVLVGSIAVLVAIGLVMIFSASSALAIAQHHDAAFFLKRQIVWLVVGIIAAFAAYRIEYEHLRRFAPFALVASVLSLGLVLIPHIGLDSGGARRWLGAGAFSLQPSEFAKLAL